MEREGLDRFSIYEKVNLHVIYLLKIKQKAVDQMQDVFFLDTVIFSVC